MLKINLLPSYIYDKKKVRKVALIFAVVVVVIIAGMLSWATKLNGQQHQLETTIADLEQQAAKVDEVYNMAYAEEGKIPPLKNRVQFVKGLMDYNKKSPEVYRELAKYTYSRVMYRSSQLSGNSLQLQAHCRTLGDYARYMINIYRATHLFSAVNISTSIPAWPAGGNIAQQGGLDFSVSCTLAKPMVPPSPSGGGGGAEAGGGMGGMDGGMMPGMPGMMPGMPGMGGPGMKGGKMGGMKGGPGMMPPGMGPGGYGMPGKMGMKGGMKGGVKG